MKNTETTTTINTVLKSRIIEIASKQQEKIVDDFRKRVNEIMISESNEKDEYDSHQQSFKSETMAEVSLLSDQLQFADHELEQLRHIQNYSHEVHLEVEYGTVVITDKVTFFVSVGVEQFLVDGLPIFGLSVQSPIYRIMKGKRAGDRFSFAGINYQIENVF